MTIETQHITIDDIGIELIRKKIKTIRFGVYPDGRVRIAIPLSLSKKATHLIIVEKLDWIRQQRLKFLNQPRQTKQEIRSGEKHYFLGQRYVLSVNEHNATPKISLRDINQLDFYVRPNTSTKQREVILAAWYREQLKVIVPPLIEKWQLRLGVEINEWRIKKMKTRWGTCNINQKRIWLNLELAKKPVECIEYVVLHELTHLLERLHNDRFKAILDTHQPGWREHKKLLNSTFAN
jgi:predicted metal-dependent hydrolase